MKKVSLIILAVIPFLFACSPKKPEIPMTEAPAGPFMQTLLDHSRAFSSLKALAGISASRKGRKRSFETVAVLVNGLEQFRLEAYGPLGQTAATVVWDGKALLVDVEGDRRLLSGSSALEQLIGAEVSASEFCAVLSGNVPGILADPRGRMFCAPNGSCVLELESEGRMVKVHRPIGWHPSETIPSFEVYQRRKLAYRVTYDSFHEVSGYLMPGRIVVDNPGKGTSLTIEYGDTDVNVPVPAGVFSIPGE